MTDQDGYGQFLEQIADVSSELKKHHVDPTVVEDFNTASSPLSGLSLDKRANHFIPVLVVLCEKMEQLEGNIGKTRVGGLFPKSLIARVVSVMMKSLEGHVHLLPQMIPLVDHLMGVKKVSLTSSNNRTAREAAAYLFASDDEATSTGIAKKIGVSTKTVSQWKQDERFKLEIEQVRELLSHPNSGEIAEKAFFYNLYKLGKEY